MAEKKLENSDFSWRVDETTDDFRVVDLATDNHDTIAIFEKTGDDDYDDLTVRPHVELFIASPSLVQAAKGVLGDMLDASSFGPECPDDAEYADYPVDADGNKWYPVNFALLQAVQLCDPHWPKYSRDLSGK
jgi:hypothetical protein